MGYAIAPIIPPLKRPMTEATASVAIGMSSTYII